MPGTITAFYFGDASRGREGNIDGARPYGTEQQGARLGRTASVGLYKPNAFGLYDTFGNVSEWCSDAYEADAYASRSQGAADPFVAAAKAKWRVVRDGSWRSAAGQARSAARRRMEAGLRDYELGFRVARDG